MEIHLTPELETFICEGIESGRFSDVQTALMEGLNLLREQNNNFERLHIDVQIGMDDIENGRFRTMDAAYLEGFGEQLKQRGMSRLFGSKSRSDHED